ncbi:MAG: GIY-YIG nuclease family protein, partial [Bacteroidota bacterium]
MKTYYIYITTNPQRSVLYTGVTNDLNRRLKEHYENRGLPTSFAGKYYCYNLIYFDLFFSNNRLLNSRKSLK